MINSKPKASSVREQLIEQGKIIPDAVPTEVVTCTNCESPFGRIAGRVHEKLCGHCQFVRAVAARKEKSGT